MNEITEIVNRETEAWKKQDAELLMTIFHDDMGYYCPKSPKTHNPLDWVIPWAKYYYSRWKELWQCFFDTYKLVHFE